MSWHWGFFFLSNFFTCIDHRSRMTQIDSFEFHFYITSIKIKEWENIFSKNRIFRLVDYKKSFWSSVTRCMNDWWSIIIDHQWHHYIIPFCFVNFYFTLLFLPVQLWLFLGNVLILFLVAINEIRYRSLTKTRLFKYTENFTTKKWKLSDEKFW